MIGRAVSHYKILEKLGAGGMGEVYKAQDLKLDRFVALKFLSPHLTNSKEQKQRFIHEAKAASALQHNNICAIHEIDEAEDGQIFICMDYYEGETLNKRIKEKPLPLEEAIDIAIQIAQGLTQAHEKRIVHRDIKPANIMLTKKGVVKILDFGLAKLATQTKLTKDGSTIGTIAYMSPEQTKGTQVDQRTDIWSLGVVLYEMLTGELPFKGDYDQAIIYSILNENLKPITTKNNDFQSGINHIITKALYKNPDERYQTTGEFLSDLQNFIFPENKSLSFVSAKISKKHYLKWLFYVFGALILLVASTLYFNNPFKSDSLSIESIVVLPFENYTGSDELEYFVSGMHSSLIGDIGKISALRIISETTSNAYKNVEKSISDIASELHVDAVVEASVLSIGDSIRVQIKLVSAFPEEQQIWVQDYYEEKSQILNLYNRATKEISDEINVILTPQEESLLAESRTVNTLAYDTYLKGKFYLDQIDQDALQRAKEYFNIAIDKDPNWAPPYAGLAEVRGYQMQMGFVSPSIAIPKIYDNLNKALALEPNSSNSHYISAVIAVWTEWNWEKGEKEFLKALELNPNNALCRIFYAHLLMILRRSDEALYHANLALKLDPLRPFVLGLYAVVMRDVGDYQSAIAHAEKALAIDPDHRFARRHLAGAYNDIGDYDRWFELWKKTTSWDNEVVSAIEKKFREHGYFSAIEEIINVNEEAAKEGHISIVAQARRYYILRKYEKALEWLERGYEIHDPNMPYITTFATFDQLKDNPRFIELLKKMKLPYAYEKLKDAYQ